jgi:hypothetical protein
MMNSALSIRATQRTIGIARPAEDTDVPMISSFCLCRVPSEHGYSTLVDCNVSGTHVKASSSKDQRHGDHDGRRRLANPEAVAQNYKHQNRRRYRPVDDI